MVAPRFTTAAQPLDPNVLKVIQARPPDVTTGCRSLRSLTFRFTSTPRLYDNRPSTARTAYVCQKIAR